MWVLCIEIVSACSLGANQSSWFHAPPHEIPSHHPHPHHQKVLAFMISYGTQIGLWQAHWKDGRCTSRISAIHIKCATITCRLEVQFARQNLRKLQKTIGKMMIWAAPPRTIKWKANERSVWKISRSTLQKHGKLMETAIRRSMWRTIKTLIKQLNTLEIAIAYFDILRQPRYPRSLRVMLC